MYKEPDNEFYEDVLVTALEGGSNYWIDHMQIGVSRPRGIPNSIWVSDAVNAGKTVLIFADGAGYGLTKAKLVEGLSLWVKNHPKSVLIVDGEIDAGQIDAGDADAILQYALFGKLVYG